MHLVKRKAHDQGQGFLSPFRRTATRQATRRRRQQQRALSARSQSVTNETSNNGQADTDPTTQDAGRKHKFWHMIPYPRRKRDDIESQRHADSHSQSSSASSKKLTIKGQLRTVLISPINILLVCAPVGIALNYVSSVSKIVVFVVNFIAIIPLAGMLSFATEQLALYVGETLGGLLNATFGNAVELIVSIIALFANEIVIVQTSLIGSMLSNLLLVLGMCFFFGGIRYVENSFNQGVAQMASSMLALAIAALIIPTAFEIFEPGINTVQITPISRGTSIILLIVYGSYLYFQLKTHKDMYMVKGDPAEKHKDKKRRLLEEKERLSSADSESGSHPSGHHNEHLNGVKEAEATSSESAATNENIATDAKDKQSGHAERSYLNANAGILPLADAQVQDQGANAPAGPGFHPSAGQVLETADGSISSRDPAEDEKELTRWFAVGTLAASTALVALCAEFMVDSIDAITSGPSGISKEFVGLILLPIVGNAAEHATAVTVACKDKMDLAIGVAAGSSMQIALLVLPLVVVIGWIAGIDDMNLDFDGFQVTVLFVAIILVNYLIADGKSNYLEGLLLQMLYIIIALSAWYYSPPAQGTTS